MEMDAVPPGEGNILSIREPEILLHQALQPRSSRMAVRAKPLPEPVLRSKPSLFAYPREGGLHAYWGGYAYSEVHVTGVQMKAYGIRDEEVQVFVLKTD
jgi:hypothetical protein